MVIKSGVWDMRAPRRALSAFAVAATLASVVGGCSSEPEPPANITVSGTVQTAGRDSPFECTPLYSGIEQGDDIVISSNDEKLGIGQLGKNSKRSNRPDPGVVCVYPFSIPNVAADRAVYTINIAGVEEGKDFSREALNEPLALSVS